MDLSVLGAIDGVNNGVTPIDERYSKRLASDSMHQKDAKIGGLRRTASGIAHQNLLVV
jgi:hypothetical protein